MKKFMMYSLFMVSLTLMGCGKSPIGGPCVVSGNCLSGICDTSSGTCVGKANGATCSVPGECNSGQCDKATNVCEPQTCSPACLVSQGDVCLADSASHCAPVFGLPNGEFCDNGAFKACISLKCPTSGNPYCQPRSDGSFCVASSDPIYNQCGSSSSCVAGVCQPNGSSCTTSCTVGNVCRNGACVSTLLEIGDSCNVDSNCATGYCDPTRGYRRCAPNPGNTCTPTYPPASSVACLSPILPNNGCGSTPNGTGTQCSSGFTCQATGCVANTLDGAALYASYCQNCHGALASSSKRNRTASQISAAITANSGGMGSLSPLTSAEIQAIANALSTRNFAVAVPSGISITAGQTSTVTITVTTTDNTSKVVALSVSGPTGFTFGAITPQSVTVSSTASKTATFTVTPASTLAATVYNVNVVGTVGTDTVSAVLPVTVTTSGGGNLLPNGSSCTLDTECGSSHCGPTLATSKICLGKVDYKSTAGAATECWSGVFLAGTNICGPAQFKACAPSSRFNMFQFWNSSGAKSRAPVQVDQTTKCVLSDPSLDETSATEDSDLFCTQYTDWAKAGVACNSLTSSVKQAIWNKGRDYNIPLKVMSSAELLIENP